MFGEVSYVTKWAILASFCLFSSFSHHNSNVKWRVKSIDVVLGDRTWGRRMVCADRSTEQPMAPTLKVLYYWSRTWSDLMGNKGNASNVLIVPEAIKKPFSFLISTTPNAKRFIFWGSFSLLLSFPWHNKSTKKRCPFANCRWQEP